MDFYQLKYIKYKLKYEKLSNNFINGGKGHGVPSRGKGKGKGKGYEKPPVFGNVTAEAPTPRGKGPGGKGKEPGGKGKEPGGKGKGKGKGKGDPKNYLKGLELSLYKNYDDENKYNDEHKYIEDGNETLLVSKYIPDELIYFIEQHPDLNVLQNFHDINAEQLAYIPIKPQTSFEEYLKDFIDKEGKIIPQDLINEIIAKQESDIKNKTEYYRMNKDVWSKNYNEPGWYGNLPQVKIEIYNKKNKFTTGKANVCFYDYDLYESNPLQASNYYQNFAKNCIGGGIEVEDLVKVLDNSRIIVLKSLIEDKKKNAEEEITITRNDFKDLAMNDQDFKQVIINAALRELKEETDLYIHETDNSGSFLILDKLDELGKKLIFPIINFFPTNNNKIIIKLMNVLLLKKILVFYKTFYATKSFENTGFLG